MTATLRSAAGSFRSATAISSEKTRVIPVGDRKVAVDDRNVEVGDRNEGVINKYNNNMTGNVRSKKFSGVDFSNRTPMNEIVTCDGFILKFLES
jgi:hypothetical protein